MLIITIENVECQSLAPSCEVSLRAPRFVKRAVSLLTLVMF